MSRGDDLRVIRWDQCLLRGSYEGCGHLEFAAGRRTLLSRQVGRDLNIHGHLWSQSASLAPSESHWTPLSGFA